MSLERFHQAQGDSGQGHHARALAELHAGRKRSHWIWFIFPQLEGLGHSSTARFYALRDLEEACDYLRDPVLRTRYESVVTAVVEQLHAGNTVEHLMGGRTDALKLVSSVTLFHAAASRLDHNEPTDLFSVLSRTCEEVLRLTQAQGYPPCSFTLVACGQD